MPKPVVYIGLALVTDGYTPGQANILNITTHSLNHTFTQNVAPQDGVYRLSKYWQGHTVEFEQYKTAALRIGDALAALDEWCAKFQGRYVLASTPADFWHLYLAYRTAHRPWGFLDRPVDTSTIAMARTGAAIPAKPPVVPEVVTMARQRYAEVGMERARSRW